ncbi:hypothetical protein PR048_017685 [Dryococelus australis]|uniref:Uncharacterized protein n=1 Tax=Dryococelus australis TaxID=614101 RepID=A0ABQ9HAG5_9NEOP|nr:hypothetical protein PR048_017685 [Dryococelus australis]
MADVVQSSVVSAVLRHDTSVGRQQPWELVVGETDKGVKMKQQRNAIMMEILEYSNKTHWPTETSAMLPMVRHGGSGRRQGQKNKRSAATWHRVTLAVVQGPRGNSRVCDPVSVGAAERNARVGDNGNTLRKPAGQLQRPSRFSHAKICRSHRESSPVRLGGSCHPTSRGAVDWRATDLGCGRLWVRTPGKAWVLIKLGYKFVCKPSPANPSSIKPGDALTKEGVGINLFKAAPSHALQEREENGKFKRRWFSQPLARFQFAAYLLTGPDGRSKRGCRLIVNARELGATFVYDRNDMAYALVWLRLLYSCGLASLSSPNHKCTADWNVAFLSGRLYLSARRIHQERPSSGHWRLFWRRGSDSLTHDWCNSPHTAAERNNVQARYCKLFKVPLSQSQEVGSVTAAGEATTASNDAPSLWWSSSSLCSLKAGLAPYPPHGDPASTRGAALSLAGFRVWKSCWTTPITGGFSRGTPVSSALANPAPLHPRVSLHGMSPNDSRMQVPAWKPVIMRVSPRPGCSAHTKFISSFSLSEDGNRSQFPESLFWFSKENCADFVLSSRVIPVPWHTGAAVAERLDCSPPTKANRVQCLARPLPLYHWSVGFLGDLPFTPPLHYGAAPFSPHFTLIGSQDHFIVKSRPNLSTQLVVPRHRPPATTYTTPRLAAVASTFTGFAGRRRQFQVPSPPSPPDRHTDITHHGARGDPPHGCCSTTETSSATLSPATAGVERSRPGVARTGPAALDRLMDEGAGPDPVSLEGPAVLTIITSTQGPQSDVGRLPSRASYVNSVFACEYAYLRPCANWRFQFPKRPRAAIADRLACSALAMAIRVHSPAGSPDSRMWESCRTVPLVGLLGPLKIGDCEADRNVDEASEEVPAQCWDSSPWPRNWLGGIVEGETMVYCGRVG